MSVNISNANAICYYPFDTDAYNYVSGTGVNDAVLTGAAISTAATNLTSGSIYFSASPQSVKIPTFSFGTNGVTVATWVKFLAVQGGYPCIFSFATSAMASPFDLYGGYGTFCEVTANGTTYRSSVIQSLYNDTNWHHYCMMVNPSGKVLVYIDGNIVISDTTTYPSIVSYNKALIGLNKDNNQTPICYMNQFMAFNRIITSTEFAFILNKPKSISFSSAATSPGYTLDSYVLNPTFATQETTSVSVTYNSPAFTNLMKYTLKDSNNATVDTQYYSKPFYFYRGGSYALGSSPTAVYVGNGGNIVIRKLSNDASNGTPIASITTGNFAFYNFSYDNSNQIMYGCTGDASGIMIVDPSAGTVQSLGTAPSGSGIQFSTVGADSNIYATSSYKKFTIYKCTPSGTFTTLYNASAGSIIAQNGNINFCGIATDSSGYLYTVTQDASGFIYKFDTSGTFLGTVAKINMPSGSGGIPWGMFCDTTTNTLYVSVYNYLGNVYSVTLDGTVSVFTTGANYGMSYSSTFKGLFLSVNSATTIAFLPTNGLSSGNLKFTTKKANLTPGSNVFTIYDPSNNAFGMTVIISVICFREGTLIRCLDASLKREVYVPVEHLTKETYVLTKKNGYKRVEVIGNMTIHNPNANTEIDNRLFVYRAGEKNPTVFQDLYITGNHCALVAVTDLSDDLKDRVREHMGDVYETEGHYRLPACLDERAEAFTEPGEYRIWHFALEHDDVYANYGVLANGLLVESASIDYLQKYSKMKLV